MESSLYQISLIAAFGAGMVALFAPCCISFLLPSYFGNIFRERSRVILMTLVYSLGILTVMLPIVLGAKALSLFFFRFHDQNYLVGGVFLMLTGLMTFLGIKLPLPHIMMNQKNKDLDVWSTFSLGIFSGITSACCAPVLLGVMSLSALSVTWLGALGVGGAYVLGMVFPLYVASYFLDRGNVLAKPMWRKKLGEVKLGRRVYPIFLANVVGAAIFGMLGVATMTLAITGGLGMPVANPMITQVAEKLTQLTQGIPLVNIVFIVLMGVILSRLIDRAMRKR